MAASAVSVSVEAVIENQIQEVTLDGQEIYTSPLSMSENLTKLAHKIDFYKDESEDKGKPTSEGEKEVEEEKTLAKFQPSLWPWDSIRNKLKGAMAEMSVLWDVLNIAKEKRYMVLDPVSHESTEPKAAVQLLAKKRGLSAASTVLMNGSERLKKSQAEISQSRPQTEFHLELLKLRQNWRLKKVGNTILGDLSYKSDRSVTCSHSLISHHEGVVGKEEDGACAGQVPLRVVNEKTTLYPTQIAGSRFYQGGSFEVKKSDKDLLEQSESVTPKSALEVVVPSELEGVSYIHVEVKTVPDVTDVTSAILKVPSGAGGAVPTNYRWQRRLEDAQCVLFCKELFAQLAREAVQAKSAIPHLVIGNQIITNIFPGVQLSIVLCHYTGREKKVPQTLHNKLEHHHVLEHSLHQLLREFHHKNSRFPMPHPATAPMGMSKRRRLAGPAAASKRDLAEMMDNQGILEQIIKQTKHSTLRQRVRKTIDELAKSVPDPQITAHWSCLNSSTEASVRIHITSVGYETIRTFSVLQIGVDTMELTSREGRTSKLSFEQQELHDLLLWQISQHNVSVIHLLARVMGWQTLSSSIPCVGVGDMEKIGAASSIMLASPQGHRTIAVKSGPSSGLHVSVQFLPRQLEPSGLRNSSVVKDPKWSNLGGSFQKVNLEKLDGKNFANKLELLMTCLASTDQNKLPGYS